jgi:hypothetical protein
MTRSASASPTSQKILCVIGRHNKGQTPLVPVRPSARKVFISSTYFPSSRPNVLVGQGDGGAGGRGPAGRRSAIRLRISCARALSGSSLRARCARVSACPRSPWVYAALAQSALTCARTVRTSLGNAPAPAYSPTRVSARGQSPGVTFEISIRRSRSEGPQAISPKKISKQGIAMLRVGIGGAPPDGR